ncbi:uncharacterized protein [Diabrotica undecimpunctata]|uniref:uncharacterized protein n=1 Tax=Diabrotica undecimpunctata TaxID=50387 RepID=UPI003B6351B6
MRESKTKTTGTIFHYKQQCIAYADNVVRRKKEIEHMFKNFEDKARKFGLYINEEKTKYMQMRSEITEHNKFVKLKTRGKDYKIENVSQFEYLGVTITNKGDEEKEIEKRILKVSRAIGSLNNILKAKNACRAAKIQIYETVIRPVAVYACEIWTMNKKDEMKIEICERKVLRKIFGHIRTAEENWSRRTNKEVMEMYGKPLIVQKVKAQRVSWLGHIPRMPGAFGGGGGV